MVKQVVPRSLNSVAFQRLQKRCQLKLTPAETKIILGEINQVVLPNLHKLKNFNDLSSELKPSLPQFEPLVNFRRDFPQFNAYKFFRKNFDNLNQQGFIVIPSYEKK